MRKFRKIKQKNKLQIAWRDFWYKQDEWPNTFYGNRINAPNRTFRSQRAFNVFMVVSLIAVIIYQIF